MYDIYIRYTITILFDSRSAINLFLLYMFASRENYLFHKFKQMRIVLGNSGRPLRCTCAWASPQTEGDAHAHVHPIILSM